MTIKSSLKQKVSELFGIDPRSLALFRISTALLIIADLINRARDLRAHYSDWGILPRGPLIENFARDPYISLHLMNGTTAFQAVLFIIAGLVAVGLLIGYRTRLMTFLSWFLLISLQSRNPMVLQAGDVVLRMYLFWALFLPLGASYSVDSALNNGSEPIPKRILSAASIALLLQVFMIYFFTALLKAHPRWWVEGSAIYYALSIDQLTTGIGHWLLQYPGFLRVLTFAVIYLEWFGPFLAFFPIWTGRLRTVIVLLFIGMHLSFILFMKLGLFPYISIVGWFVFLPSGFWEGLLQRLRTPPRQGLIIYYDGDCGFCKKMVLLIRTFCLLPETPLIPAQSEAAVDAVMRSHNSWVVVDAAGEQHIKFEAVTYVCSLSPLAWPFAPFLRWRPVAWLGEKMYEQVASERSLGARLLSWMSYRPLKTRSSRLANVAVVMCLLYVVMWNVRTTNFAFYARYFPQRWNWFGYVLRLDQYWNMFAPYPLTDDGWYVIPGQLKNGREVDLFRGGSEVSWQKPVSVSSDYSSQRWRKYMMNIWKKRYSEHRLYYGRYLCRLWNSAHRGGEQLQTFQIYFMREDTPLPGQTGEVQQVKLWSHDCFAQSEERARQRPARSARPRRARERMRIQEPKSPSSGSVDSVKSTD